MLIFSLTLVRHMLSLRGLDSNEAARSREKLARSAAAFAHAVYLLPERPRRTP